MQSRKRGEGKRGVVGRVSCVWVAKSVWVIMVHAAATAAHADNAAAVQGIKHLETQSL
jgi:hypothetical protein